MARPAKPNLWKEQGGVESVSDVGGREESGQGKHVTSEEGGRGVNSPLCEVGNVSYPSGRQCPHKWATPTIYGGEGGVGNTFSLLVGNTKLEIYLTPTFSHLQDSPSPLKKNVFSQTDTLWHVYLTAFENLRKDLKDAIGYFDNGYDKRNTF